MENSFNIDDFYLPLNTLKRVVIGTILLDTEMETEYVTEMLKGICRAIHDSGYHEDAMSYAFHLCDGVMVIYKCVPLLDVNKHLEPN